jgi:hypothetical protein
MELLPGEIPNSNAAMFCLFSVTLLSPVCDFAQFLATLIETILMQIIKAAFV